MDGFRERINLGLRQIGFLLIPAGVVTAVLAEPITRIVYQRGKWDAHDTAITAACVAAFSGGLVFNGWMLMLNRGFFSLQENWLPTLVALTNLGLNAVLDAVFYRFGTWGIPLSTTLVNVAGAGFLLYLMRRRLGGIDLGHTLSALGRIVIASACAALAYFVWLPLDRALGHSFVGQLGSLLPALVSATALYLGACRLLHVRELDTLLSLRSRRP
jgi:putative peptidoglycan lipid II flippase